jgi:hypothetical protein
LRARRSDVPAAPAPGALALGLRQQENLAGAPVKMPWRFSEGVTSSMAPRCARREERGVATSSPPMAHGLPST